MEHWMWSVNLTGIVSTAVLCGTDMFFLTVGRAALKLASPSAGTEVMGFFHFFGDARMPVWGVLAILSNLALLVLDDNNQRWFFGTSMLVLIFFLAIYNVWSKPINRRQIESARTGRPLDNGRELQQSWDRSLTYRVPLLVISLLAQCLGVLVTST